MCIAEHGRISGVVDEERRIVSVDIDGRSREISLAFLSPASEVLESWIGAIVAIHVGFAVQRLDEAEIALLTELSLMP